MDGKAAVTPLSPLAATLSVEDDEDEDGNDRGNLTDAQKKLLQATLTGAKSASSSASLSLTSSTTTNMTTARPRLDVGSANKTPQTSIMTNEDLQSKLGFQLPPPPPPPPPSTKKVQSAPSSVNDVAGTKSTARKMVESEFVKKVVSPEVAREEQAKAVTTTSRDHPGSGSSFEVTGYNGAKIGAPFFNLDVALPGGKKGRILVCRGALPERMAAEFVAVHGLSESVLPKLLGLITNSIAAQEAKEKAKSKNL
jgi:hypothetical protein